MSLAKEFQGLKGKTIQDVVSLTKADIQDAYWYCEPEDTILVKFTDGTGVIVMADPEGNGPGCLAVVELIEDDEEIVTLVGAQS